MRVLRTTIAEYSLKQERRTHIHTYTQRQPMNEIVISI